MSLNIVVNADVAAAGKQIQDFSKQSRIALTNLSLVAQDLPFGFIGIQNNLPGVIQSFSALRTEAGGTIPALKQLGASLIGPAGLFLAFSAVTSAITFAIKEYGSLSNAINALTSSNKAAALSQITFDKELQTSSENLGAEEAKIKILVKTLSDLSKPLKDRQNAYAELKKIQPDIVRNISEENALTQEGIKTINELSKARIQYIKLKAQEAAVSAVINENVAKQLELETKVNTAAQALAATRERIFRLQDKSLSTQQQNTLDVLISKEKDQVSTLKSLSTEYNQLIAVKDLYLNKLEQNLTAISAYDAKNKDVKKSTKDFKYEIADLKNMFSFKTQIDDAKELADTILDVNKKYTDRVGALNKLNQLSDGTFNAINLEKTSYIDIKDAIDLYIQKLQILDIELQGRIKAAQLQEQADRNAASALNERIKAEEDLFNQITERTMANDLIDNQSANIGKANLDAALQPLKDFQEGAKKAAILIEDTFFRPLNDMFTELFTKGTFSFKKFTQSILQSIGQIAAKLVATGIVQSLISIFSIPFGGPLASGGALGFLGDVINPNRRRSNVDFSNVRGGSSMEMGGQVNLVLRGADLVGSINRTNAQILRTG